MANPLTKSDKEELQSMRRLRAQLVQETANAKACHCNVAELEEALAMLDTILEEAAKAYLGGAAV